LKGIPIFNFFSGFDITEPASISEAVADNVNTVNSGNPAAGFFDGSSYISQKSPLYGIPLATAFAESITLPPPTAKIPSTFYSFATIIASRTFDASGFG
jgi:hypothetical protein